MYKKTNTNNHVILYVRWIYKAKIIYTSSKLDLPQNKQTKMGTE